MNSPLRLHHPQRISAESPVVLNMKLSHELNGITEGPASEIHPSAREIVLSAVAMLVGRYAKKEKGEG